MEGGGAGRTAPESKRQRIRRAMIDIQSKALLMRTAVGQNTAVDRLLPVTTAARALDPLFTRSQQ